MIRNEPYRAQAWAADLALRAKFPDPTTVDGAAVVTERKKVYPAS